MGKHGTLNQNSDVFPLSPNHTAPGTGSNTSPGTLQAGAHVELLSTVAYGGNYWVRVRILDGEFHHPFAEANPRPTSGWLLNGYVTWAPTTATPAKPVKRGSMSMNNVFRVGQHEVDQHNSDGSTSMYFDTGAWRVVRNGSVVKHGVDPNGTDWKRFTGQPLRGKPGSVTSVAPAASTAAKKGWYVQVADDGLRHAYRTQHNKNLGIYVDNDRVVQPANGGRLWALYDIAFDGTLRYIDKFGSVGGAPPPPNAAANEVPTQLYPPPSPVVVGPAPTYVAPAPTYVAPSYAPAPVYAAPAYAPAPTYVPAPVYAAPAPTYYTAPAPPTPVYVAGIAVDQSGNQLVPWQSTSPDGQWVWSGSAWVQSPAGAMAPSPALQVNGVPAYNADAAALYTGAAYGAEAAMATMPQQPAQQTDPLTASIMMGGGISDSLTTFGGMTGGFDPSTLAALAGGNGDLAAAMALGNGGYDPTMGGMVDPYAMMGL